MSYNKKPKRKKQMSQGQNSLSGFPIGRFQSVTLPLPKVPAFVFKKTGDEPCQYFLLPLYENGYVEDKQAAVNRVGLRRRYGEKAFAKKVVNQNGKEGWVVYSTN